MLKCLDEVLYPTIYPLEQLKVGNDSVPLYANKYSYISTEGIVNSIAVILNREILGIDARFLDHPVGGDGLAVLMLAGCDMKEENGVYTPDCSQMRTSYPLSMFSGEIWRETIAGWNSGFSPGQQKIFFEDFGGIGYPGINFYALNMDAVVEAHNNNFIVDHYTQWSKDNASLYTNAPYELKQAGWESLVPSCAHSRAPEGFSMYLSEAYAKDFWCLKGTGWIVSNRCKQRLELQTWWVTSVSSVLQDPTEADEDSVADFDLSLLGTNRFSNLCMTLIRQSGWPELEDLWLTTDLLAAAPFNSKASMASDGSGLIPNSNWWILFDWYIPDPTFLLTNFKYHKLAPQPSFLEGTELLYKAVWTDLPKYSLSASEMLRKVTLGGDDITEALGYLADFANAGMDRSQIEYAAACQWIKTHSDVWQPWVAVICLAGQFKDETGICELCLGGTFSESGASSCTACSAGSSALVGAGKCDSCPPGFYAAEPGMSTCVACPTGSYTSKPGSTGCTVCDNGLTTVKPGADSNSDCICDDYSMYDAKTKKCYPCEEGLNCVNSGNDVPKVKPGYWVPYPENVSSMLEVSPSSFYDVYRCESTSACPGGDFGICGTSRIGIACGACEVDHFVSNSGECMKCSSSDSRLLLVAIFVLMLLTVLLYVMVNRPVTGLVTGSMRLSLSLAVGVQYVQNLAILFAITLNWPELLSSTLQFFSFFLFNMDVLRPTCFLASKSSSSYLIPMTIPLWIIGWFLGSYFLSILLSKIINSIRGLPLHLRPLRDEATTHSSSNITNDNSASTLPAVIDDDRNPQSSSKLSLEKRNSNKFNNYDNNDELLSIHSSKPSPPIDQDAGLSLSNDIADVLITPLNVFSMAAGLEASKRAISRYRPSQRGRSQIVSTHNNSNFKNNSNNSVLSNNALSDDPNYHSKHHLRTVRIDRTSADVQKRKAFRGYSDDEIESSIPTDDDDDNGPPQLVSDNQSDKNINFTLQNDKVNEFDASLNSSLANSGSEHLNTNNGVILNNGVSIIKSTKHIGKVKILESDGLHTASGKDFFNEGDKDDELNFESNKKTSSNLEEKLKSIVQYQDSIMNINDRAFAKSTLDEELTIKPSLNSRVIGKTHFADDHDEPKNFRNSPKVTSDDSNEISQSFPSYQREDLPAELSSQHDSSTVTVNGDNNSDGGQLNLMDKIQMALPFDKHKVFNTAGFVITLFYTSICSTSFTIFHCYRHPNGRYSVVSMPHIICYDSEWYSKYFPAGFLATILFAVGYWVFLAYVNLKTPILSAHPAFIKQYSFLISRYRPERWWWESILMLRNLALTIISSFVSESPIQLCGLMIIILFSIVIHAVNWPLRDRTNNILELCLLGSLTLHFLIAMYYVPDDSIDSTSSTVMECVLVILLFCTLIACISAATYGCILMRQAYVYEAEKKARKIGRRLFRVSKQFAALEATEMADAVKFLPPFDLGALEQFITISKTVLFPMLALDSVAAFGRKKANLTSRKRISMGSATRRSVNMMATMQRTHASSNNFNQTSALNSTMPKSQTMSLSNLVAQTAAVGEASAALVRTQDLEEQISSLTALQKADSRALALALQVIQKAPDGEILRQKIEDSLVQRGVKSEPTFDLSSFALCENDEDIVDKTIEDIESTLHMHNSHRSGYQFETIAADSMQQAHRNEVKDLINKLGVNLINGATAVAATSKSQLFLESSRRNVFTDDVKSIAVSICNIKQNEDFNCSNDDSMQRHSIRNVSFAIANAIKNDRKKQIEVLVKALETRQHETSDEDNALNQSMPYYPSDDYKVGNFTPTGTQKISRRKLYSSYSSNNNNNNNNSSEKHDEKNLLQHPNRSMDAIATSTVSFLPVVEVNNLIGSGGSLSRTTHHIISKSPSDNFVLNSIQPSWSFASPVALNSYNAGVQFDEMFNEPLSSKSKKLLRNIRTASSSSSKTSTSSCSSESPFHTSSMKQNWSRRTPRKFSAAEMLTMNVMRANRSETRKLTSDKLKAQEVKRQMGHKQSFSASAENVNYTTLLPGGISPVRSGNKIINNDLLTNSSRFEDDLKLQKSSNLGRSNEFNNHHYQENLSKRTSRGSQNLSVNGEGHFLLNPAATLINRNVLSTSLRDVEGGNLNIKDKL